MPITFHYHSNNAIPSTSTVQFAASFLDWAAVGTIRESDHDFRVIFDRKFEKGTKLFYKFIVDGTWVLSDDTGLPTEANPEGILNHVLEIQDDQFKKAIQGKEEDKSKQNISGKGATTATDRHSDITLSSNSENTTPEQLQEQQPQQLRQRNHGDSNNGRKRSSSQSSDASTVIVLYNRQSAYSKFLSWCYLITVGKFINGIKYAFGISNGPRRSVCN